MESGKLGRDQILCMLKDFYYCNKEAFGIERIGLFGSFARNEGRTESDIDIIITLSKPDLFKYSVITNQLEKVFGRHVDLVSSKTKMSEEFKKQLEKEAIYVF